MKKISISMQILLLLSLLIGSTTSGFSASKEVSSKKHVVILSMDGFRWDYTLDAHTPTLDSLRRVGSYSQMMPVFPSNTFPSHYAMATGLYPNHHGITNNSFYDSATDKIRSVFDAEDCNSEGFWGGVPIWNEVELQGGISHIHMWPGSEYPINGRRATRWQKYDHNLDYFVRADNVIESISLPSDQAPNLVMWYMPDPDEVGHHTGPNSAECIARVEYIDSVLSYFFVKARETPYYDDINFIFTSDHGMAQLDAARYINLYPLLDNSKVIRHISGSPFCFDVEEDYIDEAVERINSAGNLRAYRADAMPERFNFGTHPTRCTNVVVLPNTGWKLDYRVEDGAAPAGGSHGFDPEDSDMQVIFFGVGPDFKRGYSQPTFQNQNIYLVICHLLGIEPAQGNDCNFEDIKSMFVE